MIKTEKISKLIESGAEKGYDCDSIEKIYQEIKKEVSKKEDNALFIFRKNDILTLYDSYFTLWKALKKSNQELRDKIEKLESEFDYVENW